MTRNSPSPGPGTSRLLLGWTVLAAGVLTLLGAEQIAAGFDLDPWQIGDRQVLWPVPPALVLIAVGVLLVKSWTRTLRRRSSRD